MPCYGNNGHPMGGNRSAASLLEKLYHLRNGHQFLEVKETRNWSVDELLKWWTWRLQSYIIMYLEPYLEAAECEMSWLYTSMEIIKVVVDISV